MAESGSYAQIATVNSVQINVRQYTCINVTAQRNLHDSIRNSRNIRKLSTCANSGYQALFSDFSNGPGGEANTAWWEGLEIRLQFWLSYMLHCLKSRSPPIPSQSSDREEETWSQTFLNYWVLVQGSKWGSILHCGLHTCMCGLV